MSLSITSNKSLVCGRCLLSFPDVSIVKCGKELLLCKSCHRQIHPRCLKAISIETTTERLCNFCAIVTAKLSCPMCSDGKGHKGYLLCHGCSDVIHHNGTSIHLDHVMSIPTV